MAITITNPDGQSATLPDAFTYDSPFPPPTIRAIAPRTGPYVGGTQVTLTGAGFRSGLTVAFGGLSAVVVGAISDTSVIVSSPPAAAPFTQTVDVTVTNADKQSATLPGAFAYVLPGPTPYVASVSPDTGSVAGGEVVSIKGSGFLAGSIVSFGSGLATVVSAADSAIVVLTPPAPPGFVDVKVTNPDQQSSTLTAGYNYSLAASPFRITAVVPNVGLVGGGTPVVITGTGFQPGATALFGSNPAAVTANSSTTLSVTTPPATFSPPADPSGPVNITVVNPDGRMAMRLNAYTYAFAVYTLKVENLNAAVLGGVLSDPAAINCAATCTAPFASGTTVTLNIESLLAGDWTGCDGVDASHTRCIVVMNADKTVTVR